MSFILRRTKIVATLGPATDDPKVLADMVRAGVDVVRLNFSHGDARRSRAAPRAGAARRRARGGRYVGVLGDLQGPKIRIDRFAAGKVELADGAEFTLDASLAVDAGTDHAVGIAYKKLPSDVFAGDVLLLNDGTDQPAGARDRRPAHQDARAGRRRTRQQQGHQPPGRGIVGRRADRQGPRGHPDRGARSRSIISAVSFRARCRRHERGARAAARGRRPRAAGGQDRARRGDQEFGRGGQGERCRDGGPRRSRRRDGLSPSSPDCKSRSSRRRATRTAWSSWRRR